MSLHPGAPSQQGQNTYGHILTGDPWVLWSRSFAGRVPRELPPDQRYRYQAGVVELRGQAHGAEILAELPGALHPQLLDEVLAGDVASAVSRLAQVQVLLEPEQVERAREVELNMLR